MFRKLSSLISKKKLLPPTRQINRPGYYILSHDIETSDLFGIQIKANDVILDLNGYTVKSNNTEHLENFGIYAANVNNVKICNGKVEGFYNGVMGNEVQDFTLTDTTLENIKYIAINLTGVRCYLFANTIINLDFTYPKDAANYYLIGIRLGASESHIFKNVIKNANIPQSNNNVEYVGILISANTKHNLICDNQLINATHTHKKTYGVWCGEGSILSISDNLLVNHYHDIAVHNATINSYKNQNQNSNDFEPRTNEFKEIIKDLEERLA